MIIGKTRTNQPVEGDKAVLDGEIEQVAEQLIQADKDILSQIKVEFNEENFVTYFYFPKGVMPLSITLNTHDLFLKSASEIVDDEGQQVSGYSLDEYFIDTEESYLCFNGDLSEQVISGLTYVLYDFTTTNPVKIENSYNLFFPVTSAGTKLYKHKITLDEVSGTPAQNSYRIAVISTIKDVPSNKGLLSQLFSQAIVCQKADSSFNMTDNELICRCEYVGGPNPYYILKGLQISSLDLTNKVIVYNNAFDNWTAFNTFGFSDVVEEL